ncbi:Glycosyl transferases group 1 [compost metagenome]
MLCGTPVVAYQRGSMPELIKHGKTGFLVKDVEEAVEAITRLGSINRKDCQEWAISRFSQERMVKDYISLYHQILSSIS